MPFVANNGKRIKPVTPGILFPVKREKKLVALLAVKTEQPDSVEITLVDGVVVKLSDGKPVIRKDTTLKACNFEICDPKTGAVVSFTYESLSDEITLGP